MNIDRAILEQFASEVHPRIKRLASMANSDLWSGPLYLTADGEETSMFDPDYHHSFNFSKACGIIQRWCEKNLPATMFYESWSGCLISEDDLAEQTPEEDEDGGIIYPDDSLYLVEYDAIKEALFGKELARHI